MGGMGVFLMLPIIGCQEVFYRNSSWNQFFFGPKQAIRGG